MKLDIQISLIIFSILYGIVFSIFLNLNYRFLHHKNIIVRYLSTIICVAISVIIYFKGIQKISYGIFHIYSLFLIIIGFSLENIIHKLIEKYLQKWYNLHNSGDILWKEKWIKQKKFVYLFLVVYQ